MLKNYVNNSVRLCQNNTELTTSDTLLQPFLTNNFRYQKLMDLSSSFHGLGKPIGWNK